MKNVCLIQRFVTEAEKLKLIKGLPVFFISIDGSWRSIWTHAIGGYARGEGDNKYRFKKWSSVYLTALNETGITVPANDPCALGAAIRKLDADDQLCEVFGKQSRLRYL